MAEERIKCANSAVCMVLMHGLISNRYVAERERDLERSPIPQVGEMLCLVADTVQVWLSDESDPCLHITTRQSFPTRGNSPRCNTPPISPIVHDHPAHALPLLTVRGVWSCVTGAVAEFVGLGREDHDIP